MRGVLKQKVCLYSIIQELNRKAKVEMAELV
jgi:hypothetical protein